MQNSIKVGLIGFGLSGRVFHFPLLANNSNFKLFAASTRNPENLKNLCPDIKILSTEEILKHPEIDLVIITSPNETHAHYCEQALNFGKHVLVEKPFTLVVSEANNLCKLARSKGKILSVFHNRRYDSNHITFKAVMNSGALGKVTYYESHLDRFRPEVGPKWKEGPQAGAGVLYDLGSHLIDQMLDLFGMPLSLSAALEVQRPGGKSNDFFSLRFNYAEGPIVHLRSSSFAAANTHRTLAFGTKSTIQISGMDPQEHQLSTGMTPSHAHYGKIGVSAQSTTDTSLTKDLVVSQGCYPEFYQNLAEAILTNVAPPGSPEVATNVVYLINCALESALKKRTVFTNSFDNS